MPEVVSCPKCQRRARVPDDLVGKAVKCPGCGETFTAVVGPAPVPVEETKNDEDEGETYGLLGERRRRRGDDDDKDYEVVKDRQRRREDDEDEQTTTRRRRTSREDDDEPARRGGRKRPGESNDPCSVTSVVIGGVSLALVVAGCCTCGVTWYMAAPLALIGGVVSFWGRGNMRVAGLVLNILAFLPALLLSILLLVGVALPSVQGGSARPNQPWRPPPVNNPPPVVPPKLQPRR